MADNAQIAKDVLAAVGGAENITSVAHCMTRLRVNLKDESIPNDDEIKKIKGVLGSQWSGGQYQIIIGQNVPKVYDAIVASGVAAGGSIDENLDGPAEKKPLTPKTVGEAILNYLSKSMVALIPIMMGAAMFKTVAIVCGPGMLNLWAEDSEIYTLFASWLYNAGFYFIPITLGWSAANVLGCSPQLGMMMGGILMAPELIALTTADPAVATTTIYGFLPAPVNDYSATVLPIILCMPVLSVVEKFCKKVIPDMLSTVFVPVLTMFIMTPVGLCVLAPIGTICAQFLGDSLFGFASSGGITTVILLVFIAGFWEFLVMTGMHQVLLTLGIVQLLTAGSDSCVMVGGGLAQFATWGMAFGAFLRLKEADEKGANFGYFLSGFLGGVTEPALYGCGFKYTRCLVAMVGGGAIAGLVAGLTGVTTYVLGATNILGIVGFVAGGTFNLVAGCASSAIAFFAAAAIAYFFGFTKEQLEEDAAAAAAAK